MPTGPILNSRIRLARSIGSNDRGEVGIAKEQCVVALIGLEVYVVAWSVALISSKDLSVSYSLNNSKRISFPIVNGISLRQSYSKMWRKA
jgi:hypothetical protein